MSEPEVWLRGPVEGVPALLQPVAHGLLQCREEMRRHVAGLSPGQLAARPAGAASIEYHVRHSAGSLDRLFAYARGEGLSAEQRAALVAESSAAGSTVEDLLIVFEDAVQRALRQLRTTDPARLLDAREVGRAKLPSTVIGLLFHAAEHTQRHIGQVATTSKVVRDAGTPESA